MALRIDGSNQPSPILDNSLPKGSELTAEKQQLANNFEDVASKAADILNQTVRKGDMESARARVADLKGHFESLSTDLKKEMYSELTQKGAKGGLKETFDYKLSTPSRENLLKILNPDHVSPKQLSQADVEKTRASKTGEKNLEGKLQQASLQNVFDSKLGGQEIKSQNSPGAIKMPTFGPGEGPGAVKMPTFDPGDGPGAIKMPEPKAGEPGIPFSPGPVKMPTFGEGPGAVKMPTFGPGEGPGAIKMPEPKSGEPATPFTPGPVKMPTFPTDDSGPGAIKMPTFGPSEGPGATKMPEPKSGNEILADEEAIRKFLKGEKK